MTSITRTLTLSLSFAVTVIFLVALTIDVWLIMMREPTAEQCETAAEIVMQAAEVDPDGALTIRTTPALEKIRSGSPSLWYAVSYAGHIVEFAAERRPTLPFGLLYAYTGPTGRSFVDTRDRESSFCLEATQTSGSELIVMLSGAQFSFGQFITSFILGHLLVLSLMACAFAATVAAGAMLSARFVSRSIERVTQLALAIEPAAPHASIPLDTVPSELIALVTALNRAFDEIDAHMRRQRRFLGNAAHELRTPLTLLRAKIEEVPSPALKAELIRDVRRLTSLVSAMLDLARLQGHALETCPVNLSALAREVLADFAPSALNNGVDLSLEQNEAGFVIVEGVEAALRSALANLVGNALIHAQGATRIIAELKPGSVTISDDGAGLPPNQGRNLIEPFQKGEGSKQGAGLGLSIVREIMVAHGGSLTLASMPGHGTSAHLRFPAAGIPARTS